MATEMNVEAERAAPAQPRDYFAWWTSIETDVRKSMLVFAHREPERLHALVRQAYEAGQQSMQAAHRAAQSADVGAGELPKPGIHASGDMLGAPTAYTADQMRQYARAAIAHQAAPAQPSTAPSALVQTLNKPSRIDAYVRQLAMSLWRTHYRETSPKFELLDDTHGVLTQIDNMITGLVLAAPTSDQQAAPSSMADAYVGAREDFAIWKKRALEAEESCRRLTAVLNEQNSPTFMGEPVLRTSDQQAGVVAWEYCPECGSYETHEPSEDSEGQFFCAVCNQEWHLHIDYTDVVRKHLGRRLAAPAAIEQAGAPIDVAAIRDIADELSLEASNYEGDFADTVNGCADALNHIVEQAGAQPVAQADQDALDAKRYRWLRDPRNTESSSYVAVYGCTQLDTAIDAAMTATPVTDQDATKQGKN